MNKLFGREPALILGLVGAALTILATLGIPYFDSGAVAAIMAALTAVATAALTRPVAPALFVGALVALAALFGYYGMHLPDATIAAGTSFLLAAFALFGVRPQVTPQE